MAKEKCMKLSTLPSGIASLVFAWIRLFVMFSLDSRQVKSQLLFIALPGKLSGWSPLFFSGCVLC